jgi:hypothetical protein
VRQLGELRFMGAPRLLELFAVGAQSLDLRGVHRTFYIELCPAGIDLTMRFADLLPLGGGPGLEFGLLLQQGGALDLEIAELLGGRLCLVARGAPASACPSAISEDTLTQHVGRPGGCPRTVTLPTSASPAIKGRIGPSSRLRDIGKELCNKKNTRK